MVVLLCTLNDEIKKRCLKVNLKMEFSCSKILQWKVCLWLKKLGKKKRKNWNSQGIFKSTFEWIIYITPWLHGEKMVLNESKPVWECDCLKNIEMIAKRNATRFNPFDTLTQKPLWHRNNSKWSCRFSYHCNDTKFHSIIPTT